NHRTAQCSHVILPRKWLLWVGSRIVDWEARIQGRRSFVERRLAVPNVRAAAGGDDDRAGRRASGVGLGERRSKSGLLYGVGGEILQKAADVVVGVVAPVDGNFVVQAGAASGRDRRDACLGWVRGLDGLGSRCKISDVGETAGRQRQVLQICLVDDRLMNRANPL